MNISPEMIAAFADGELEGADMAQVEAAIAVDPALASEVERHRRLKAVLAARYAPIVTDEVPAHLVALLQTSEPHPDTVSEVISFAAARRKRRLAPMILRWVSHRRTCNRCLFGVGALATLAGQPSRGICGRGTGERARQQTGGQSIRRCRTAHLAQLRS